MKLCPTTNGQKYGWGKIRSVFDFFFPIGNRIRAESSTAWNAEKGVVQRKFYTFRAFWLHYYWTFRNRIAEAFSVAPELAFRVGAIAFDTAVNGSNTVGTSLTYSHTVTGSNPFLVVQALGRTKVEGSPTNITGATYNSVAMNLVATADNTGNSATRFLTLFALGNPATGANNVIISGTGSFLVLGNSTSYSGCQTSSTPDNFNTNQNNASNTLTVSVTTVASNCWTVLAATSSSGSTISAGAGTTLRVNQSGTGILDSNAPVSGATSLIANWTVSEDTVGIIISIAPAGGAPTAQNTGNMFFRFL